LILKISVRHEGITKAQRQVEHEFRARNQSFHSLHETIAHSAWWIAKFNRHGFKLKSKIPTPGHLCCAFVLQADVEHPAFQAETDRGLQG
jgi:hypothetical protein